MENQLKEINAVFGVIGSFVCLSDGSVAEAMPESVGAAQLELAARVVSQTFQALEASGQRVSEADLLYDKSRLILRNFRGGVLAILCSRAINIPLLNFTANLAVKKLTTELKPARSSTAGANSKPAASSAPPAPPQALEKVTPSPLLLELDQEVHRLVDAAREAGVTLRVLNSLAMWLCCPNTHALIAMPEKKQIEFVALSAQRDSIMPLFERAGYQSEERFDASHGSRRLHLIDSQRDLNIDIFLDALEMDHRLDLTAFLIQESTTISETALLLIRLQTVEMNDATLREICALLLEYDIGMESQSGKIDPSQIVRLGVNDWGLVQTISKNLERVASFAAATLGSSDQAIVAERVRRLKQSIDTGLWRVLR
jgi:hypothetical protein